MISIHIDQQQPIPVASQISGTVTWTPEKVGKQRGIKVFIRWRTEGRGNLNMQTIAETNTPLESALAGVPVQVPFSAQLPLDGPVSYNGTLLRVIWEVMAQIDEAWAPDEKYAEPFIVVVRRLEEQ